MPQSAQAPTRTRCRLCDIKLKPTDFPEAQQAGLCSDCARRPENKQPPASKPPLTLIRPRPRPFTAADKALIRAIHGYTPAQELLRILNERLHADTGDPSASYTLEDLQTEVNVLAAESPGDEDWAGLRRHLDQARQNGLLKRIDQATLDIFTLLFRLTTAQATRLADIIIQAKERPQ